MAEKNHPGAQAFGALLEISNAHHERRAPSAWAVGVVAEYFQQWLDEDGHRTLDQVLGFAAEGKGKPPYIERLRHDLRDLFIRHLVATCHAGGLSVPEACELVSAAVNTSTDTLFRKQCRQVGINPSPRRRGGQPLEYLPPKSLREIFEAGGGVQWARFAGYFGDCDESRKVARLDPADQDNQKFLHDLQFCRAFPFRTLDQVKAVLPVRGK